jgi:cytochrome c553
VTRRHQKVKRILVDEAGGSCTICGYDRCMANLHFHHLEPAAKSFAMTTASGKSLAAYREEARKCILVCANCHGELEAGISTPSPD